jgi:glycerol-3-phosphate O-acyltransferase
MAWLFHRLYDAVDVDEEGLARVRGAAGHTPIVLCPSHKSYIDFLVVAWVLSEHGMTPPHVAAGVNLSFWPFGPIARRGGAFFIRRTLRGDRIYTATLRAYVKQLLRDRFPQKFYLEGGRSRSGKMLFPKTGLFSMEVDAWLERASHDVLFVPVAIDYEQLLEGRSYARELAGDDKKKEDFRGLLRARKVLGRRYGRLYLQFGEPISLREFAEERLGDRAHSLTLDDVMPSPDAPAGSGPATDERAGQPDTAGAKAGDAAEGTATHKRQLVQGLANCVAYGISCAVTVTPVGLVAASLLSHVRRGLAADEVGRRIALLRRIAAEGGARFSPGFATANCDPRLPGPVKEALARLAQDRLVQIEQAAGQTIYQVMEDRRSLLDYHKNAVIHRYVPLSLLAAALRAHGGAATTDEVKARARWLSRLFKLEFMYRVGATPEEIFAENTALMQRLGLLQESGGRLEPGPDRASLELLADLLRPFLEAYRTAAEALLSVDAAEGAMDRKALVKVSIEHGRAAYAAGRVALRESISKATFENAVEWFGQQGALERVDGKTRLAKVWREEKIGDLLAEIEAFLEA